jgi:hypothetical protein
VILHEALLLQAGACTTLGSPFMGRLMTLLHDRLEAGSPVADRVLSWPGDCSPLADSVPLRLAAGLHALVLQGKAPPLAAAYPPHEAGDEALWQAVSSALREHEAHMQRWLDSPPQTNELRRSAGLIAAGHWLRAQTGLPIALSELGASAGLNLNWDRYALEIGDRRYGPADAVLTLTPEWRGELPPLCPPEIASRRGVDLNPIDAGTAEGQLRLLSYLWPDQSDRLERTRAALTLPPAPVDRADAIDWLQGRLTDPREGRLHMIYHTIAWQYFPAGTQARGRRMIEDAGASATDTAPLAWLRMEADGQEPGAALDLRLWPGDRHIPLGRIDFHGRWVDWTAP